MMSEQEPTPGALQSPVAERATAESVVAESVRNEEPETTPRHKYRGRLFRKYFLLILSLVTIALVASGAISIYFTYQENKAALSNLQHEKAIAAASRIEQYIRQIERQLAYAALPQLDTGDADLRRLEFLKLLRQAPEVTDLAQLDAAGREQIAVSRLGMDSLNSGKDRSLEPAFGNAGRGKSWFGPVFYRKETEPYMTIAIGSAGDKRTVTVADVNLKFIWDVVSRIKIGEKGKAYVVDGNGFLVADPDIGLVLRKTNLSALPHVRAAIGKANPDELAMISTDLGNTPVLTSVALIEPLNWYVFVEQPVLEVYEKLNASIWRTGLLLLGGLVISAVGAMALARGMVQPIRTLDEGARRIGAGELDRRIEIRTGDELQALAEQFNSMTSQLRESYSDLEQKVEKRTRELTHSLAQQTAVAEILQVISSSPTDVRPVLEAIAERAARLCDASAASMYLIDGSTLRHLASKGPAAEPMTQVNALPINRDSFSGRAIIERKTLHIHDLLEEAAEYPLSAELALRHGHRTAVVVPLYREQKPFGTIMLRRNEVRSFTDREIALLETFGDQAAIALENVRLFNETKEALDHQRASGEVLAAISSSIADTAPVFQRILANCERLFAANLAGISLVDVDGQFHLKAYHGAHRDELERVIRSSADDSEGSGGAIFRHEIWQVPDVDKDPVVPTDMRLCCSTMGVKSLVFAPMRSAGSNIGTIFVGRDHVGHLSETDITLLRTFADQAVISIQNARLLREIQEKSKQVEIASQHKMQFLANMSHELRTPLNAILGYTELLFDGIYGELEDRVRGVLERVQYNGKHLLGLIHDVLDLSKIDAGQLTLTMDTYSVSALVESTVASTESLARGKGLVLRAAVDEGLPLGWGDERRLMQVLLNIVGNAIKFTDKGSVDVAATLADGSFQISVRDSGPGIKEEDQVRIFEEFQQVDASSTRGKGGTGLGLAIAKRIVEMHGGSISVTSALGSGSTFVVILPVRVEYPVQAA